MLDGVFDGFLRVLGVVRRQLFAAVVTLAVTSLGAYFIAPLLLRQLVGPGRPITKLIFLSPAEAFVAQLKLALAAGAVAALPLLLLFTWQALRPFLAPRERRMGWWLVPLATFLFAAGGSFGFFGIIPFAMRFLLSFGNAGLQPMISVSSYISFLIWMVFPSGLVFEMPIVVWVLTRTGLLSPRWLIAKRKYAILLIFILAAVFTPADVFSQFAMAVPMLVVYEVCIVVSRLSARRRRRRLEARDWGEA